MSSTRGEGLPSPWGAGGGRPILYRGRLQHLWASTLPGTRSAPGSEPQAPPGEPGADLRSTCGPPKECAHR
eukprot:3159449-Pyramimonas_sp.AAC.1